MDQLRDHAAHGFDAERERRDVEQQCVLDRAREDAGLHRGAERHHFVRIELGMGLRAEQRFDGLAHQRDARRAAHQHHFVDLLEGDARILDALRGRGRASGPRCR